ncbi:MAG: hypothetical protein K2H52_06320 [Lachnospiraceae bacterium]|nr:hypothetical protein [Lachnospiraceae bacterium]
MDKIEVTKESEPCTDKFIGVDEIKVRCNIPMGRLESLSIRERMGAHTIAEVRAGIVPMEVENSGMKLTGQPLAVEADVDGERTLLFSGIISEIHTDREASYETISIKACSVSWLMDLERKSRSWQGEHSIFDLMQEICREHSFSILSYAQDEVTKAPFIQYRETDWAFLVRLSSHLHAPVYAAGSYAGKGLCLGLQNQVDPVSLEALRGKWCMKAEHARKMDFNPEKAAYYEVVSGQVLHLGQSVLYHRTLLRVLEADMDLKHGMLCATYRLAGPMHFHMPIRYNPYIKGVSLEGTVLDRMDENVKVHLDIDKVQERSTAQWYPWMPEHGNMVYCMPEEGSRIRLLIPGEDEREAIGIHCVRQNGAVCSKTQNPDQRWFATHHHKNLTLQPSFMELSAQEGASKIGLEDGMGSSLRSEGEILIQAKGQIFMQGMKVVLDAPGEITAVKRELGQPAVVNICHNLDAMGKKTVFRNLEALRRQSLPTRSEPHEKEQTMLEKSMHGEREEKKKDEFKLEKLLEQESERNDFELGDSVIKIISAIPQCTGQDRIAQITAGFRPIAGRMKDI